MQTSNRDLPPPVEPVRGHGGWRLVIGIGALIGLLALAVFLPIPSIYAFLPGPVKSVEGLVEVGGAKTYSSEGDLYLTTVSVDTEITFVKLVAALIDPNKKIVGEEQVTGGGSQEDVLKQARQDMRASQQHAEEVALSALGIAEPEANGVRIAQTAPDSPASGVLKAGDLIVAVDDSRVSTTCQVGSAIAAHDVGDEIQITVRRKGRRETFSLSTRPDPTSPNTPIVGILMEDVGYRFDSGLDVKFDIGEIGGPSAGLMFTLALYDKLTADDLTAGRKIAGTGEIACDGGVGPIGGIEQKVAGAEAEGAEIFLAPAANAEAAQGAARDIEVVSVDDFQDAVDYLEGLE